MLKIRQGADPRGWAGAFFSLIISYLYFEIVFPSRGFVAGTSSFWQTQVQDITQYIAGLTAFRNEAWGFPLLHINSINWPVGTNVGFNDAIPLMALIVKLADPIIPTNPFGFWVLMCFLLMGLSAWWTAKQAGLTNWVSFALAIGLSVQMPALLQRLGHLSLMAHFLVVLALGLYFRDTAKGKVSTVGWALLLPSSFYINFYHTAMVATLMIASAVDLAIQGRAKGIWRYLVAVVPIALTFPFFYGWGVGSKVYEGGFNYYSMNLLSPIIGGTLIQFPTYVPGTAGQYEGYNYLGLGLIAGVLALALSRRGNGSKFGNALIAACIGLFVYSLSNDIYVGPWLVAHWEVPSFFRSLAESFRVTGRFLWPVSYVLVFFVAASVARLQPAKAYAACLAILAVQWADLQAIRDQIHDWSRRPPEVAADASSWKAELAGAQTIYFYPKFRCGKANGPEILPIQMLAVQSRMNFTTGFIARYSADCEAETQEKAAADLQRSVFVYASSDFSFDEASSRVPAGVRCHQRDQWFVCR